MQQMDMNTTFFNEFRKVFRDWYGHLDVEVLTRCDEIRTKILEIEQELSIVLAKELVDGPA